MTDDLADLVAAHVGCEELAERMRAFYEEVDAEIAARGPTCWNRGDCCKFDAYDHNLFVTSVELTYFATGKQDDRRRPEDDGSCPYQIDGRCTAREHRPLGCRVFFCDPNAKNWQGPLYEARLKQFHQLGAELGVDYRYVEWLSALNRVFDGANRT